MRAHDRTPPVTLPPALLDDRSILRVAGPDARTFLQALLSNDVARLAPGVPVYATLLTPQGRFLFDMILIQDESSILLDTTAARAGDLLRKLLLHRLRAAVELEDASGRWAVVAAAEPAALPRAERALVVPDPRLAALGVRALVPRAELPPPGSLADSVAYDRWRLALGVPVAPVDLVPERSLLLESNVEELHGIDFGKGCYVGQELTARMKYRGLVKKRLLPVRVDGALPPPGTILSRAGAEAGEMRSGRDRAGIALVRLDGGGDPLAPLEAPEARLHPWLPDWLRPALGH